MKKSFFLTICLLLFALLSVVWVAAQDAETTTYVLGVAQPFTGPLGSFGTDFSKGIELAVEQMNAQLESGGINVRFEIASQDTEGTPEGAAQAVQTIVQTTGAQVIVGRRQPDRVPGPSGPDVGEVEHPQRLTGGQADALTQSADYC